LAETFQSERHRDWVANQCKKETRVGCGRAAEDYGALMMQRNEIFHLVVSVEHRRKGVARTLIRKAKTLSKQEGVRAKVVSKNISIARLLVAEGFQCDGVVPGVPGSITPSWIGYSYNPT
jgi:ribosomal protein S18 acetylase RimI-like enzyme